MPLSNMMLRRKEILKILLCIVSDREHIGMKNVTLTPAWNFLMFLLTGNLKRKKGSNMAASITWIK